MLLEKRHNRHSQCRVTTNAVCGDKKNHEQSSAKDNKVKLGKMRYASTKEGKNLEKIVA